MLILILIMMLKLCIKESRNLIGLANFGTAEILLQPGWVSAPPVNQKVAKSVLSREHVCMPEHNHLKQSANI